MKKLNVEYVKDAEICLTINELIDNLDSLRKSHIKLQKSHIKIQKEVYGKD